MIRCSDLALAKRHKIYLFTCPCRYLFCPYFRNSPCHCLLWTGADKADAAEQFSVSHFLPALPTLSNHVWWHKVLYIHRTQLLTEILGKCRDMQKHSFVHSPAPWAGSHQCALCGVLIQKKQDNKTFDLKWNDNMKMIWLYHKIAISWYFGQ